MKLEGESVQVDDYGNFMIQLINRGEFIQATNDTYELTTIKIHLKQPLRMRPHLCPQLVTGFVWS
jgi:hypothetical protein